MNQISTIAYFRIDINPDGTLNESAPVWNGYQSEALPNLVTRAHAAGDRVVLTVICFDQSTLDQLTTSTSGPSTWATELIGAIRTKNLDGVSLDFEVSGNADQNGLTSLVIQVSAAIHGVNRNYQVTMDTYATPAGDPSGFYNIRALAPAVDGFLVMEYQLNLESEGSAVLPPTSTMFSDRSAVDQYLEAVPASKLLLGLPYSGIDWPTTDGTLTTQAGGPAAPLSYGQIVSSGHPVHWDPTTETFFEDPTSLYDATQLATANDLAGVGVWALGMNGNDPSMLSALLGFSPAVKDGALGPEVTSQSLPAASTTSTSSTTTRGAPSIASSVAVTSGVPSTTSTDPATTAPPSIVPDTTSTASTTTSWQPTLAYHYSGDWNGQTVILAPWSDGSPPEAESPVGRLPGASTSDPTIACLTTGPNLNVEPVIGHADEYLMLAADPSDCVNAAPTFTLEA